MNVVRHSGHTLRKGTRSRNSFKSPGLEVVVVNQRLGECCAAALRIIHKKRQISEEDIVKTLRENGEALATVFKLVVVIVDQRFSECYATVLHIIHKRSVPCRRDSEQTLRKGERSHSSVQKIDLEVVVVVDQRCSECYATVL